MAAQLALELLAKGQSVRFVARGHSMRPFVRDGDQVEVSPGVRPRVGDLVLLRQGDFGVVHRVVARFGRRLLIKGDNLPRADGWFTGDDLLGVVVAVRHGDRRVPSRRLLAVGWSAAMAAKRTLVAQVALRGWRRARGPSDS